ncbi:MAG: hypothetical protein B6247_13885 [Candidatus Parabeggiatoa sp. nov. 2]|nr:MAG: hypothetical protein B6247_13885 [Beggiatoa sp. 4572_84]
MVGYFFSCYILAGFSRLTEKWLTQHFKFYLIIEVYKTGNSKKSDVFKTSDFINEFSVGL